MTKIMITGIGGPAGRSLAQQLLKRHHTVIGADMRIVDFPGIQTYQVPAANDPTFVTELRKIATLEQVDLLIPTVTEELMVLAEAWNGQGPQVVLSSYAATQLANDKYLTSEQLRAWGVSIPRYALPSQVQSPDDVAAKIGWPCLSKPRVSRGGRGVVVHDETDWPAIAALNDSSILQEFASGTDYAPNVYLGRNSGEPVVVALEKTALTGGHVGNAVAVQRVDAPDVANLALAAVIALGLQGPLDVDIRRRADGTPVVLEVNARFGANSAHAPEILTALLTNYEVN
jgi:carbamoylphosphate synthase large subunit